MKERWTDYLPAPLHGFLSRVKAFLCRTFFPPLYAVFSCLPIQNRKIIFDNYQGRGFGCNTKYVAQKMIERGAADKYDLVWLVSRRELESCELPPQIRAVRYGSLKSLLEYATAGVWVSNYHKIYYVLRGLHKRKEQYFIQMWHGSLGIKKIDGDVAALTQDKRWLRAAVENWQA